MAIKDSKTERERDSLIESTVTAGQPARAVVNPDGSNINGSSTTALELIDDSVFTDDTTTFTPGTNKGLATGGAVDDTATDTADEGDMVITRHSARRAMYTSSDTLFSGEDQTLNTFAVNEKPQSVATYTPDLDTSTALEASSVSKAAAGVLYGFSFSNTNAAARYLQFFNATSVPADTAVPVLEFLVPLEATIEVQFPKGIFFSMGIAWCNSSTNGVKTIGSADSLAMAQYK